MENKKWNFKKFWKESNIAFVIKNILLAGIILIVLVNVILFAIDGYTHHGEAEIVPDLRGKYTEEAEVLLAKQNLHYQIIDSMYDRQKPLGAIVEQTPPEGSTLKKGRPIYLIINSKTVRQVPIPDVRDVSFRQAEAMLKALELNVGHVEYEPSEYKDLVLDVQLNGNRIEPGTRLPEGTVLTLIIGAGTGSESVFVPDVLGLTYSEARSRLLESNLVSGAVNYDVEPNGNEQEYAVYKQQPTAGSWSQSGARVDIWLSMDTEKVVKGEENTSSEDSFF